MSVSAPSERTRVKRLAKRAHYDRKAVHAVLDAGFVCHVGYAVDGEPYVTPTCYWREGEWVYWHGASASRMLRHLEAGASCCLTVTHVDALVLARSGFHHSVNYRSVMLFGRARKVEDPDEKLSKLHAFVERLLPGRWPGLRAPTRQELKATTVLGMTIAEASVKIRTGPPVDEDEDYALPIWAGIVPLRQVAGTPQDDGRLAKGAERPENLEGLAHIGIAAR